MIPTRFFLVKGQSNFYYALIKAMHDGHALEIYDSQVSRIDTKEQENEVIEDMKELSLESAIQEMKSFIDGDEVRLTDGEILEMLADDDIYLLGVDKTLIQ